MFEFNEFKPRLKSPKTLFQMSAGLNLEKFNTIYVEPTIFEPRLKFKPRLKFFKFGLCLLKILNLSYSVKIFLIFDQIIPWVSKSFWYSIYNYYKKTTTFFIFFFDLNTDFQKIVLNHIFSPILAQFFLKSSNVLSTYQMPQLVITDESLLKN